MVYAESILKVLVVGLILGAGLPAVFAVGLVAFSSGSSGSGEATAPNPALKALGTALFVLVGLVVLIAILWITRNTIIHHFGFDPFFGIKRA